MSDLLNKTARQLSVYNRCFHNDMTGDIEKKNMEPDKKKSGGTSDVWSFIRITLNGMNDKEINVRY